METKELLKAVYDKLEGDKIIWAVVFALAGLSILTVYSATGSIAFAKAGGDTGRYVLKHTAMVIAGLLCMYGFHRVNYVYYSRLSRWGLFISGPLLVWAWAMGTTLNDASRWLTIPVVGISVQPSDFARLMLITNMASMLWKRQRSIDARRTTDIIMQPIAWTVLICGLIGMTNISTSLLLFATICMLLLMGRMPIVYLFSLGGMGVVFGGLVLWFGQRAGTALSRLTSYLSDTDIPFQAAQSYTAIVSGGLFGVGTGDSVQRYYLPHSYSDFIFALFIEEQGLLGALVLIALYLVLLWRGMVAVERSQQAFGALLAAGITFSIVLQAFVHMGVVVGLLPLTGLPLPLMSMGGTSYIITCISMGIVLSVSRGQEHALSPYDAKPAPLPKPEPAPERKARPKINAYGQLE